MNTRLLEATFVVALFLVHSGPAKAQYLWYPWAAESFMHGYADVVRSMGEYNLHTGQGFGLYNLYTSQAAINMQVAENLGIENHLKAVDYRYARQRSYETRRAELRRPPATREQLASWNHARLPKRLTRGELERATGTIHWPGALRAKEFTAIRRPLVWLFRKRAAGGGIDADDRREIRRLVDEMRAQLKREMKQLTAGDYIHSSRFLDSLAYEAQLDVEAEMVAGR